MDLAEDPEKQIAAALTLGVSLDDLARWNRLSGKGDSSLFNNDKPLSQDDILAAHKNAPYLKAKQLRLRIAAIYGKNVPLERIRAALNAAPPPIPWHKTDHVAWLKNRLAEGITDISELNRRLLAERDVMAKSEDVLRQAVIIVAATRKPKPERKGGIDRRSQPLDDRLRALAMFMDGAEIEGDGGIAQTFGVTAKAPIRWFSLFVKTGTMQPGVSGNPNAPMTPEETIEAILSLRDEFPLADGIDISRELKARGFRSPSRAQIGRIIRKHSGTQLKKKLEDLNEQHREAVRSWMSDGMDGSTDAFQARLHTAFGVIVKKIQISRFLAEERSAALYNHRFLSEEKIIEACRAHPDASNLKLQEICWERFAYRVGVRRIRAARARLAEDA